MDGAGSYSVAHRAGLLPTELTGMWGWILLRSPRRGRGSAPAPAPTKQRPGGRLGALEPPRTSGWGWGLRRGSFVRYLYLGQGERDFRVNGKVQGFCGGGFSAALRTLRRQGFCSHFDHFAGDKGTGMIPPLMVEGG